MFHGAESRGYISLEELKAKKDYPTAERLKKGPVAIIECLQDIPCNPCQDACPVGAIKFSQQDITGIPLLDQEACLGCKKCIPSCPGQAIFVVDYSYSEELGTLTFPYEYLPLPQGGMELPGVSREGKEVCPVTVVKVEQRPSFNKTALVTIAVPKEYLETVRFIKYRRDGVSNE